MVIPPGGESTLRVTVTPPAIGRVEKSIRIHTDSTATPSIEIPVIAMGKELTPPYFVIGLPAELRLRTAAPGIFPEHDLELQTVELRNSDYWIQDLSSDSSEVVASLLTTPEESELTGDAILRRYRFRLEGAGPVSPDTPTTARLLAVHPDGGAANIEPPPAMFVSVEFVTPLQVIPGHVSIADAAANDFPIHRKVLLIANGSREAEWKWELAEPLPDWVVVHEHGNSSGAIRQLMIEVLSRPHQSEPFFIRFRRTDADSVAAVLTLEL